MRALLVAISLLCPTLCLGQDVVSSNAAYQLLARRLIEYDLIGQSLRGPMDDPAVELLSTGQSARTKASLLSSAPITIVNVLNSTCPVCQVEMPALRQLAEKTKTPLLLWYDMEESGSTVDAFREAMNPSRASPSLYDPKKKLHEYVNRHTAYPNEQTPKTLLVDSQGVVRFALTGSLLGRQELLQRAIERLHRLPGPAVELSPPKPSPGGT